MNIRNKSESNLRAIRSHLLDAREGYRKRLANLWEANKANTILFTTLQGKYNLIESKIDEVDELLCPSSN